MSVELRWLLDGIAQVPANDASIDDLALDSRTVAAGSLFFALAGTQHHGLKFAAQAAARGARVVLWEPGPSVTPPQLPANVFSAPVPQLRTRLGQIADRFFGTPSDHLRITGITGTNGKTTCAFLLAQALERLGRATAYIGTIGTGRPYALQEPTRTTPDVIALHRLLAQLRDSGVREVAIEVSSHALDQERVAGVRFHTAAFTNLTRDHLDYHQTMAAYGEAKAKLLRRPELKQLVVNVDDAFGRAFAMDHAGMPPLTAVWIGEAPPARAMRGLYATRVMPERQGVSLSVDGRFGRATLATHLVGRFNAENALVILACLVASEVSLDEAVRVLSECHSAPGRMEVVTSGDPAKPMAVVDYAHTPDALAKALGAAREHCSGALWCVFGCGGDRDPGKRPLMGAIADQLADQIIVTDDNPRTEDSERITRAIAEGIRAHTARVINDRAAAIATAIGEAGGSDLVLIAGKGHENYQIYGHERRAFSDRAEAARCLGVAA